MGKFLMQKKWLFLHQRKSNRLQGFFFSSFSWNLIKNGKYKSLYTGKRINKKKNVVCQSGKIAFFLQLAQSSIHGKWFSFLLKTD